MFTSMDKAIAAFVAAGLLWLNSNYGFTFKTSPETAEAISTIIIAIVVWTVPNKAKKV